MSAKQAINDKLQGSVAACLRYGGVVNNQIKNAIRQNFFSHDLSKVIENSRLRPAPQIKKGLLLSVRVKNFFNR